MRPTTKASFHHRCVRPTAATSAHWLVACLGGISRHIACLHQVGERLCRRQMFGLIVQNAPEKGRRVSRLVLGSQLCGTRKPVGIIVHLVEMQGYETGDRRLLAALAGFSFAATAFTHIAPRVAFGFPVT